MISRRTLGL
ncbi:Protein of unknown function [Leuconostoc citreum LBAE C10]|nr:Protein of unknown function [Leuconostoc citreum LBAE C10]